MLYKKLISFKKKILILGGGGYVGTFLAEELAKNYKVKIIDTFWFGNFIKKNSNLIIKKKNILNLTLDDIKGYSTVVVLSCLSNDPSSELDAKLSYELNIVVNYKIAQLCKQAKIQKLIYASSGSVYGLKPRNLNVNEMQSLKPISEYNKAKMISERIFLSYDRHYKLIIIRPGTVCGYSKRMRFDTIVNIFCNQALSNKKITVFGGNQLRPLIDIKDMIRVYQFFIKKNLTGIYNVNSDVVSAISIADLIVKKTNSKVLVKKSKDPRSYRLDSTKIKKEGFNFKYSFEDSIIDNLAMIPKMTKKQINFSNNLLVLKKILVKGNLIEKKN